MIHPALHPVRRQAVDQGAESTMAIMDSQSVQTCQLAPSRGLDDHQPVKGGKGHIGVERLGISLRVKVHPANLADGKPAFELFRCSSAFSPSK